MTPQYARYLKSKTWKTKKTAVLRRDKYRCRHCGTKRRKLHVHHLTYSRIFRERLTDLITLCSKCHAKVHGKSITPRVPKMRLRRTRV